MEKDFFDRASDYVYYKSACEDIPGATLYYLESQSELLPESSARPIDLVFSDVGALKIQLSTPLVNPFIDRGMLANLLGLTKGALTSILKGHMAVVYAPTEFRNRKRGDFISTEPSAQWLKETPCFCGSEAVAYLMWKKGWFSDWLPEEERSRAETCSYAIAEHFKETGLPFTDVFMNEVYVFPSAVKSFEEIHNGNKAAQNDITCAYSRLASSLISYGSAVRNHMRLLALNKQVKAQADLDDLFFNFFKDVNWRY